MNAITNTDEPFSMPIHCLSVLRCPSGRN